MFVADLFKSRCRLEAKNLFLRHHVCTENLIGMDEVTELLKLAQ
jgi:hypothetical protein